MTLRGAGETLLVAGRGRAYSYQRWVSNIGNGIELVAAILGSLLLLLVFVCLLLQVIYRYVLFLPLLWTEEAARFGLVWLGMLAAVMAARRGLHFIFRFGTMFLPDIARRWLRIVVNLCLVFFLGVFVWESWFYLGIVQNQTAPATGLNMIVPYLGLVVGGVLMLIMYLAEVADAILSLSSGLSMSQAEAEETANYQMLKSWRASADVKKP